MITSDRLKTDWLLATEMHKLAARVWHHASQEQLKVVMFTSPSRGDGKSTTVSYLSTVLAMYPSRRILAVDFDFREPSLARHLGVEAQGDFGSILRGDPNPSTAVIRSDLRNLDLALPRSEGEDPGLLLKTAELDEAFQFFRGHYDLVMIDAPALIPIADASLIIPFCDAVILTVMSGKTTKHGLKKAREACLGLGANILGVVVGNVQDAEPGYARNYYNGGAPPTVEELAF